MIKPSAAGERVAIFIDESGDSAESLLLAALVVPLEHEQTTHDLLSRHIDTLREVFPAMAHSTELHGVELGRKPKRKDKQLVRDNLLLDAVSRAAVYRQTLEQVANLPGARVVICSHRWKGRVNPPGEQKGHRQRRVMGQLVRTLVRLDLTVASATVDRGDQFIHYYNGFETAARASPVGAVTCDLGQIDARLDLRVQLADLIAFAALAHEEPTRSGQTLDGLHHWLEQLIGPHLLRDPTGAALHLDDLR